MNALNRGAIDHRLKVGDSNAHMPVEPHRAEVTTLDQAMHRTRAASQPPRGIGDAYQQDPVVCCGLAVTHGDTVPEANAALAEARALLRRWLDETDYQDAYFLDRYPESLQAQSIRFLRDTA